MNQALCFKIIFFIFADENGEYWSNVNAIIAKSLPFLQSVSFNRADIMETSYSSELKSSTPNLHCPIKVTMPPYLHHLISVQGKEINISIIL